MIDIENEEIFGKVIAGALARIDNNREINTFEKLRWVRAIAKASMKMQTVGAFMDWDAQNETLLIWSDSNEIYETSGNACQCLASFNGQACWHRAAKRLIELYILELDRIELQAIETRKAVNHAISQSPYLKNDARTERLGTVRI